MIKRIRDKISNHPLRRKVVKVLMVLFLGLVFLEFLVYFGSNLFLVNWTRTKLNEATGGVYQIDFNRLNFSLIRRGVFLNGIVMRPTHTDSTNSDQVLFDFTLDELSLKNLWYDWSDHVFTIGDIRLDNPDIGLELPAGSLKDSTKRDTNQKYDSLKVSPVKRLEDEIKKSLEKIPIGGVYIDKIEIVHADLLFLNFLSQNSINAKNTRLVIQGVDWTSSQNWKTPFNAKGFEFDLESVRFELPDLVHTLFADEVMVSSLEKRISIEKFKLESDQTKVSPTYYDVDVEQLRVGNVDLDRAFMESELEVDEIILLRPKLQVLKSHQSQNSKENSGDLNELIEGLLKSFHVQELSVNQGHFLTSDFRDSLKNRIEIDDVEFKMIEFYLGGDEERKKNQFFYGQDASMNLGGLTLYLSDEAHIIKGEKVLASSFLDEIKVQGFQITPRDTSSIKEVPNQLINVKLNELELTEANLKKLYNQGILDVERIGINSPQVEIVELSKSNSEENNTPERNSILLGYLNEVNIEELDLKNGKVQFKNEAGVRSNDIGFESFGLLLENVRFSPDTSMRIQDILLADEMVLSLEKYKLKLRDNLHVFSADNIVVDSKKSVVAIENFSLRPDEENIQNALDTYNKTVAVDFQIPSFRMEGIDIKEALLEGKLFIDRILVPKPEFTFTRYRQKKIDPMGPQLESSEGIKDILSSYFYTVVIDSVKFDNGKFNYTDYSGRREISFSEEDLGLTLKGFSINGEIDSTTQRTFFSEEIILNLADYSFSLAKGDYDVTTNDLVFNTKEKTLVIDTLKVKPGESLNSKLSIDLVLPKVRIEGIDLEDFLFDNQLDLDKLMVDGSDILLNINPEIQNNRRGRSRQVRPKTLNFIKVNEINALNSGFQLNYILGEKGVQSIQTSFDISVKDFFMDESSDSNVNLSSLFNQVAIDINDFSFALPDSLHSIQLSNLTFDNSKDETVISGIEIKPLEDLKNSMGLVVEGSIEEIGIKNNSLEEIQKSGVFDLQDLRIYKPALKLYLDSARKSESKVSMEKEELQDPFISSLLIQNIAVLEGDVGLYTKEKIPLKGMHFPSINFSVGDLNFDVLEESNEFNPQVLIDKGLDFSLSDYEFYTKDSLELLTIKNLTFSGKNLQVKGLNFSPSKGRYSYLREKGFQTDAIDLDISQLDLVGIDFKEFFENKLYKADRLLIDKMHMDVFRDKRLPELENVFKPMPQYLMENANLRIWLDSIRVSNGRIRYQEFTPGSQMPGGVAFENLNVSLSPFVTSLEGEPHPVDSMNVQAVAWVMGEGEVDLQAHLLFEPQSPMDVTVQMGPMDLTSVNDILSKGAFVKAKSGRVNSGDWSFRMDNEEVRGKMLFLYEGLKVDLVDSLTMVKGRGKLAIESFLANTLIKNNNPRKLFGNAVGSDIYVKRNQSKFIFNTWWKATLSGLKGSIGLGQPQMPKRKEED